MPGWLPVLNHVNPLSYEVDALRGLLIGTPARLPLDFGVTVGFAVLGVVCAGALLPRLTR
jgi:ABC-2 type transport system permease protein